MTSPQDICKIILIGCGATLVMDLWLLLLKRIGIPALNFAFIGRWAGHLFYGRFAHASIARARPISYELALGWLVHYAAGVAFAGMLVGVSGIDWVRNPTWVPAVLVGVSTVLAPFFVMQPAMGFGIAASRTLSPMKNRIRSVMNHAVFGIGLFLSACLIEWISG